MTACSMMTANDSSFIHKCHTSGRFELNTKLAKKSDNMSYLSYSIIKITFHNSVKIILRKTDFNFLRFERLGERH